MVGVFVFFAIVIGVIAVFVAVHMSKRADEAWRFAAEELGLRYTASGMFKGRKLSGRVGGCRVHVDIYSQSSDKSSTSYTRFRVDFPYPLVPGLKLTRQGFFSGVAGLFGAQDIEVGDHDFDHAVVVKGTNADRVVEFLTSTRRVRIQRVLRAYDRVVIDSDRIECQKRGVIRETRELVSVVKSLVGSARAIAAPPEEDAPLEQALEARARGDLEGALGHLAEGRRQRAVLRTAERTPPPLPDAGEDVSHPPEPAVEAVDETLMEGEILYLEGRREEAKRVFEEAREILPGDAEIDAWAAEAATPPVALPTEPAESAPPAPLDVDSVCRALFVEVSSSLNAGRVFEAHYQDREIEWEGTLKSAQPFSFDFVLGDKGGTKALVEVFDLPEVSIGGSRITAVVGLPKGEDEALGNLTGKRIRIRGRLARVDAFMRNLFVRDGSWTEV